jgi:hypothetical protein
MKACFSFEKRDAGHAHDRSCLRVGRGVDRGPICDRLSRLLRRRAIGRLPVVCRRLSLRGVPRVFFGPSPGAIAFAIVVRDRSLPRFARRHGLRILSLLGFAYVG